MNIYIIGYILSESFQNAKYVLYNLLKYRINSVKKYTIKGVMDIEWTRYLLKLNQSLSGTEHQRRNTVAIFINKKYIGTYVNFLEYLSTKNDFIACSCPLNYKRLISNDMQNYYNNPELTFVRMVFDVDNCEIGHIVFALFEKLVPKTCEYFQQLCLDKTEGYTNSSIQKVDKGLILAGRIITRMPYLKKENYLLEHDRRGVLSFANKHKYFNGPEFMISLQPSPWMNDEYVAFGCAIDGENTLKTIEKMANLNENINQQIRITSCNVLDKTAVSLKSSNRLVDKTGIETILNSIIHTSVLKAMYANVYGKPEQLYKPVLSEYIKSIIMMIARRVLYKLEHRNLMPQKDFNN